MIENGADRLRCDHIPISDYASARKKAVLA
jgi:hypothetical protein